MLPVQFWPKLDDLAKKRAHMDNEELQKDVHVPYMEAVSLQFHRYSVFRIFWSRTISGRGSINSARFV